MSFDPPNVAVYCGSRFGADPRYAEVARELGGALVQRGWGLVYGGGSVGLMGAVADAVLANGGAAYGVIPSFLSRPELAHPSLTRLEVVTDMPARKRRMIEQAGAFVALPGGTGTLEEIFEVLSWRQLELHHKPVGLLDVDGFWGPLVATLDHLCTQGFIAPEQRELLFVATEVDELLDGLVERVPRR
ncbi:MAG: TIGR00730 family Rossman fold protein [Planctomycetota bacterium]